MIAVLLSLVNHLVSTGPLVHICSTSTITQTVQIAAHTHIKPIHYTYDLTENFVRIESLAYCVVHVLENGEQMDPNTRLTGVEVNPRSPQYTKCMTVLDPELDRLRMQYDSDLFDEAKRVTTWITVMQKVSSGELVLSDTSFLKLPFFRPTLLSLQAKFQQQALSMDESDKGSQSSPHSSHSSPHTSLETRLVSSLRTRSSSHCKQESLHLLTILHSLITSPPNPNVVEYSSTDSFDPSPSLFHPIETDPTELFHPSIFDEDDIYLLAHSLLRCRAVCDLVGAENCIRDVAPFLDRTISALGSSNSLLPIFIPEMLPVNAKHLRDGLPVIGSLLFYSSKRVHGFGGILKEMVRVGVLDCMIRAVSESSFLEDYENGICVIGILLRSIRDSEFCEDIFDANNQTSLVGQDIPSVSQCSTLQILVFSSASVFDRMIPEIYRRMHNFGFDGKRVGNHGTITAR
ncbi:hypothetical protein BLNAU_17281 [Blattamonas nauphoetae]|uniref:Uncharacterized protein n=1 Tax=Blattamonas nauphoetae TaxID=2049346 RepID=A0ABQ9X956_9EUKA|nr:hypothetical protein BLNAU_17281 [Blattamonas nauphoetae]